MYTIQLSKQPITTVTNLSNFIRNIWDESSANYAQSINNIENLFNKKVFFLINLTLLTQTSRFINQT